MAGVATDMIVESTRIMKNPIINVQSAAQGRAWGDGWFMWFLSTGGTRREAYACNGYDCNHYIVTIGWYGPRVTDEVPEFGSFWFAAQKLVSLMERVVARRLRTELGMGSMQYRVLSAVQVRGEGFNQQDVADMLGTTAATVSRQIESATNEGYLTVEVSTTSRRENNVHLTAMGVDLVARGDAIIAEESETILAGVDTGKFMIAAETVQKMLDTITRT